MKRDSERGGDWGGRLTGVEQNGMRVHERWVPWGGGTSWRVITITFHPNLVIRKSFVTVNLVVSL